mmetsp:Transcript_592/g.1436  ORF Transcript_592/g.1436 Transcript_592/m.1436 type:complete len:85 (-) Transcript_592:78-332(-)
MAAWTTLLTERTTDIALIIRHAPKHNMGRATRGMLLHHSTNQHRMMMLMVGKQFEDYYQNKIMSIHNINNLNKLYSRNQTHWNR